MNAADIIHAMRDLRHASFPTLSHDELAYDDAMALWWYYMHQNWSNESPAGDFLYFAGPTHNGTRSCTHHPYPIRE